MNKKKVIKFMNDNVPLTKHDLFRGFVVVLFLLACSMVVATSYENVERSSLNQFGSYAEYSSIFPVQRTDYWFLDALQTNPLEKYIDPNFQTDSYLPNSKNWYNDILSLNSSVNTNFYGVNHARNLIQTNIFDSDYNTNELALLTDYGLMFGIFNATTNRPYFGYGTYLFTPAGVTNPFLWHDNLTTTHFDINLGEGNFPIFFDADGDGQMELLFETKEGSESYLKVLEYNASKTNKMQLKGSYGSSWVVNLTGYLSDDTTGSISCASTPVTDVPSATWECVIVSDHCSLMELWGNSSGFINEAEYFFDDKIQDLYNVTYCAGAFSDVNGLVGNVLWNDFVPFDSNDGLELVFPYYVTIGTHQKVVMVYYDPQGGVYGLEEPQVVELGADGTHSSSLKNSSAEGPTSYLVSGNLGGPDIFVGSSGVANIGDVPSFFEMKFDLYNVTNLMKIEPISVNGDAYLPFVFDKTSSDSTSEMCFGDASPSPHYLCYSPVGSNLYNISFVGTSDDIGEIGESPFSVQQVWNPYLSDFENVIIDGDGASVLEYNISGTTAHPYFKLISDVARCNGSSVGLIQNLITYLDGDYVPDIISLDYGNQWLCSAVSSSPITPNQNPVITMYPVGWNEGVCYNPLDVGGVPNTFGVGLNCSDAENDNVSVYVWDHYASSGYINYGVHACNGGIINITSSSVTPYYLLFGHVNQTQNIEVEISVNESGRQDYANLTLCLNSSSFNFGNFYAYTNPAPISPSFYGVSSVPDVPVGNGVLVHDSVVIGDADGGNYTLRLWSDVTSPNFTLTNGYNGGLGWSVENKYYNITTLKNNISYWKVYQIYAYGNASPTLLSGSAVSDLLKITPKQIVCHDWELPLWFKQHPDFVPVPSVVCSNNVSCLNMSVHLLGNDSSSMSIIAGEGVQGGALCSGGTVGHDIISDGVGNLMSLSGLSKTLIWLFVMFAFGIWIIWMGFSKEWNGGLVFAMLAGIELLLFIIGVYLSFIPVALVVLLVFICCVIVGVFAVRYLFANGSR